VNVYPFIEAEKADSRNVARACELLQVSGSADNAQRDHTPSARDASDAASPATRARAATPRCHAEILGSRSRGTTRRARRPGRLGPHARSPGVAQPRRGQTHPAGPTWSDRAIEGSVFYVEVFPSTCRSWW